MPQPRRNPATLLPGKLSALMAEKQEVQTALDNASGQAEALKGQLAQAETSASALQVRAHTVAHSAVLPICKHACCCMQSDAAVDHRHAAQACL